MQPPTGDNRSDDSMMALWEKGIKPTLFDYGGEALVCSNSAGEKISLEWVRKRVRARSTRRSKLLNLFSYWSSKYLWWSGGDSNRDALGDAFE